MRAKLSSLSLAILVICLLNRSEAIIETIGFLSSIATLEQFIEVMHGKIMKGPDSANEVLKAVRQMNSDVQSQLGEISLSLHNLPAVNDHVGKRNELQHHVDHIGFVFMTAVEKNKNILEDNREQEDMYESFREKYEPEIDVAISKIQSMLLDQKRTNFITTSLTDGLKRFENLCVSRKSELQMLDGLLATFKVSIGQYFLAKNMMYDFLEFFKGHNFYAKTRVNVLNSTKAKYNEAVGQFKKIMKTASRDLWRCDPNDFPARYSNKPEDPYHELMAFSQYMFNQDVFNHNHRMRCTADDNPSCPAIKKIDDCGDIDSAGLCRNTRKCANELTDCRNLNGGRGDYRYLCVNNNKTAVNRYTSLVPKGRESEMTCSGEQNQLMDAYFNMIVTIDICRFCQCICPENVYYFNNAYQFSDTLNNKVITGARIVIENQVINIQIQQGALLPNGVINASTVEWLPIRKRDALRDKISWEHVREIDLTISRLPKDCAITGMAFKVRRDHNTLSKVEAPRVYLEVYSDKLDLSAGTVNLQDFPIRTWDSRSPENELKLEDADVPTKSQKKNEPMSDGNQFVKFQITSLEKDGGQTTIPFIDIQEVVTNPPSPLGGAGLMLRGQPGFGGFLALHLLTYDIVDYISEVPENAGLIPYDAIASSKIINTSERINSI